MGIEDEVDPRHSLIIKVVVICVICFVVFIAIVAIISSIRKYFAKKDATQTGRHNTDTEVSRATGYMPDCNAVITPSKPSIESNPSSQLLPSNPPCSDLPPSYEEVTGQA